MHGTLLSAQRLSLQILACTCTRMAISILLLLCWCPGSKAGIRHR
jgi:hypothetical protein